jgi:hypothetical protein
LQVDQKGNNMGSRTVSQHGVPPQAICRTRSQGPSDEELAALDFSIDETFNSLIFHLAGDRERISAVQQRLDRFKVFLLREIYLAQQEEEVAARGAN